MKTLRMYLAITLTAGMISVAILPQRAYTAEVNKDTPAVIKQENSAAHKIQADIDAERNKIIEESKAITADRRKLKEAEKIADKTNIEQINQDIEKREAAIKSLKKDISDKKDRKDDLIYGKMKNMPRRSKEG